MAIRSLFTKRARAVAQPITMPVQIICETCAGDRLIPRKTVLTKRHGQTCCADCGSRNYVLASRREVAPCPM